MATQPEVRTGADHPPPGLPPRLLLGVGVAAVSVAALLIRTAAAPALALAFWRSLGGALVLLPFALRARVRPSARQRRELGLSGLLLALHFALFIGAFSYTSVASAVIVVATGPIFVGLGSWVLLKVRPTSRTWTGMGVALLGAAVVALGDLGEGAVGSNPLLGDAMALGGAVAISGYLLIGQRSRESLSVATYGTWVYGAAAVALLVVSLVARSPLVGFDGITWLAILGLLLGPQLLGHTVFNHVMGVVPATTVAVVVLIEPIAAAALAFFVLDEIPPVLLVLGAPIILLGVYLAATGARGRADVVTVG